MFEMRTEDGGLIRLSGRLDAAEADQALEDLQQVAGPMTLDLTGLTYISSAGLAVVVQVYKRLHAAGHDLRLVNLQPKVRNVFTYAGLHKLLNIE
jgi:anti-sigma B factor antagonist